MIGSSNGYYPSRRRTAAVAWLTALVCVLTSLIWIGLGLHALAAEPPKPILIDTAKPLPAPVEFKVNVNLADASQLALVPGLGPVKAKAIVAHRLTRKFDSVADVTRVKGIGPKNLAKLKPFLTTEGPAVTGTPPKGVRPPAGR